MLLPLMPIGQGTAYPRRKSISSALRAGRCQPLACDSLGWPADPGTGDSLKFSKQLVWPKEEKVIKLEKQSLRQLAGLR